MRRSAITCLLLVTVTVAATAHAGDLGYWVDEAMANSPELQIAAARTQMAEHRVGSADTLPDPQLGLSLQNYPLDSLSRDQTPMTADEIRLTQALPFPGKLSGKKKLAETDVRASRHLYDEVRLRLKARVAADWYRIYAIDQSLRLTRQSLQALADVVRIGETRYAVGKGKQQDVLRAQMEQTAVSARLLELEQQRVAILASFTSLIGRPVQSEFDYSGLENLQLPELDPEALVAQMVDRRPQVAAFDAGIERSREQKRLAKLGYYPDFSVWAAYKLRADVPGDPVQGEDFVSAGISISLPIHFASRREQVAEAASGVQLAEAQRRDFINRTRAAVVDAAATIASQKQQLQLYRDGLLRQVEMAWQATLAAYQVDAAEFPQVLDALNNRYRIEIEYHRLIADAGRTLARLEAEAGVELAPVAAPEGAAQNIR